MTSVFTKVIKLFPSGKTDFIRYNISELVLLFKLLVSVAHKIGIIIHQNS